MATVVRIRAWRGEKWGRDASLRKKKGGDGILESSVIINVKFIFIYIVNLTVLCNFHLLVFYIKRHGFR